ELLTGAGVGVQPSVPGADLDGFAADREPQPGDAGDDVERAPGHPCEADGEPEARQSLAGDRGDAAEEVGEGRVLAGEDVSASDAALVGGEDQAFDDVVDVDVGEPWVAGEEARQAPGDEVLDVLAHGAAVAGAVDHRGANDDERDADALRLAGHSVGAGLGLVVDGGVPRARGVLGVLVAFAVGDGSQGGGGGDVDRAWGASALDGGKEGARPEDVGALEDAAVDDTDLIDGREVNGEVDAFERSYDGGGVGHLAHDELGTEVFERGGVGVGANEAADPVASFDEATGEP